MSKVSVVNSKAIKPVIVSLLIMLSAIYLGQGFILKARLAQIGSELVTLTPGLETCGESECESDWTFTASKKFLLLGHILRTHKLIDLQSHEQISPITRVTGTQADSWVRLRVYQVTPGRQYQVVGSRPKATKMGYFIGLLPRSSDNDGVLSIPDIGPTVSTITGLSMAFILCLMFAAAFMGGASQSMGRGKSADLLNMFAVAGVFAAIAAFLSLGILDTLLPEGDLRNKVLRISTILAVSIPILSLSDRLRSGGKPVKMFIACGAIIAASLLAWPWIRGGTTYGIIYACFVISSSLIYARMGFNASAVIIALTIFDPLKILGFISTTDMPPVYLNNVTSFVAQTLLAGDLGGFATISMAGLAYRRFRRDLVLSNIQKSMEDGDSTDSTDRIAALRSSLPEIAQITGARDVAITISLPLGRPITQTYNAKSEETKVFDDGKIPGAVTLRSLIYGDEAMFESFNAFADRVRLPKNSNHDGASYFCACPLKVNQTIVGTMLLTGFDDAAIERAKKSSPVKFMGEDREIIHLVADRLSQSLSKLIVKDMNDTAELSRGLQKSIHQAIAASGSGEEFLHRFTESVNAASHAQVMIHEQVGEKGIAIGQNGFTDAHWKYFTDSPLNLAATAKPAYGPTVVGFRDQKSSYVKDIAELFDKKHPKTVEIMIAMSTMSVMAIPLRTLNRSFVITLMTTRLQGPADPGLVSVIEATEALFVAAIEVMSQKTSVLALGQLASRLIGDDEVRGKILAAAKSNDLPTTIGSPRTSFLLLFDLAGSSDLSDDTETQARAYGAFYDAVNRKCLDVLGGMIRKTIGDAIIVTWDGTKVSLTDQPRLLENLKEVIHYADQVAQDIGCKGARAILHHGHYFLGLVGTQTFGQIDVIGSGIDEVCKIEGHMKSLLVDGHPIKMAISETATRQLSRETIRTMAAQGFVKCSASGSGKTAIAVAFSLHPAGMAVKDVS